MKNIIKQTGNDLNNLIICDNHLKKAKMILFLGKLKAKEYGNPCFIVFKSQLILIKRNVCYLYSL